MVPAGSSTINVYRQGATVSSTKTLVAGADTISVYDPGSIRVGDTIQLEATATQWSVTVISGGSITVATGNSVTVTLGQRLIVITARPNVYIDVSGFTQASGTVGQAPSTGAASGASAWYAKQRVVDVIASGGSLVTAQVLPDQHGASVGWDEVTLEDFGGGETLALPGVADNGPALTATIDYVNLNDVHTLKLGAGTYMFLTGATVPASSVVRIRGNGTRQSKLVFNTGTGSLLTVASGGTLILEDLTLVRSSGTAAILDLQAGSLNCVIRRCRFEGGGITDSGTFNAVEDVQIIGATDISLNVSGATQGRYRDVRAQLVNPVTGSLCQVTNGASGCEFTSCMFPQASIIGSSGRGVLVAGTVNQIRFIGGRFSGGTLADAIEVQAGNSIHFDSPYITASRVGVLVSGGNDIQLKNALVTSIQQKGVDVTGGAIIGITNHRSSNVSLASTTVHSHIRIVGTVNNVLIDGVYVGNWAAAGGVLAANGVEGTSGGGVGWMVRNVQGDRATINTALVNLASGANAEVFVDHTLATTVNATPFHSGFAYKTVGYTNDDTTPSVGGVGYITLSYGAGITVTNFDDGTSGQLLFIKNTGGANAITIADGATISNTSGANYTLTAGFVAAYFRSVGVWHQLTIKEAP